MIRSVMVKGIEALTAECVLAADAAGVIEEVLASLDASPPQPGWHARADYNLDRMMVHGLRRAAEMEEVVKTLDALGTGSEMTRGTVARQRALGSLGLRDPAVGLAAKLASLKPGSGRPPDYANYTRQAHRGCGRFGADHARDRADAAEQGERRDGQSRRHPDLVRADHARSGQGAGILRSGEGWTVAPRRWPSMAAIASPSAGDGERVGGLMTPPPGMAGGPGWTVYFAAADVDAMAARVKELGGALHFGPMDIPHVGRFAVVGDPQGVAFSIMKGDSPEDSTAFKMMPGDRLARPCRLDRARHPRSRCRARLSTASCSAGRSRARCRWARWANMPSSAPRISAPAR